MSHENASRAAWQRITRSGRPTKEQIEAFDRQYGPTRRGQLQDMQKRQEKAGFKGKWQARQLCR